MEMAPPHEITRAPRQLETRKFWKASELRSFLLFYSLFVLDGILPSKFINHWFLLVYATFKLVQNEIDEDDLEKAELALKKFVIFTAKLYGEKHVSFNIHLLCHLAKSVSAWGPAWSNSAFQFEGNNQILLRLIHGTQFVPKQLALQFQIYKGKQQLAKKCLIEASPACKDLYAKLTHVGSYRPIVRMQIDNTELLGKAVVRQLDVADMIAVNHFFGDQLMRTEEVHYYKRFQYEGRLFHSEDYRRQSKRNNSVVQLTDGSFCSIKALITLQCRCACVGPCFCVWTSVVIVNVLRTNQGSLFVDRQLGIRSESIHSVSSQGIAARAISVASIKEKCVVCRKRGNIMFVVVLPNKFWLDLLRCTVYYISYRLHMPVKNSGL